MVEASVVDATNVIISLIGFIGIFVTAVFGYLTHRHAREINDSVNHRHEKRGDDAPKLYDLAFENRLNIARVLDWQESYSDGPFANGRSVRDFADGIDQRLDVIETKLDAKE